MLRKMLSRDCELKLSVCLLSLMFFACSAMPQPPKDVELCSIDLPASVCHRYLKDPAGVWQYMGDKSMDQWDKGYIITPEHLLEIKQYAKDLATWISKNVK